VVITCPSLLAFEGVSVGSYPTEERRMSLNPEDRERLIEAARRVVYIEQMRRMDDSLNRDDLWSPKLLRAIDDLQAALAGGESP
jgi:hypothetical protein